MTYKIKKYDFVATSVPGLGELLAQELTALSLKVTSSSKAAVSFTGPIESGLIACLQSRLAERVLCRQVSVSADPIEAAKALAAAFDWDKHLATATAVHIEVGSSSAVKINPLVVARDFIASAPQQLNLSRDAHQALTLHLFLSETEAQLSIDLSGVPLQRRGYRLAGGKAPLRETLAQALLVAADWRGETPLVDPFCGSGTIVIEAALAATHVAPGLLRDFFGFMQWAECPMDLWQQLCAEAKQQQRPLPSGVSLKGFDADGNILKLARANAKRAGVANLIHFERRELGALKARDFAAGSSVVTNPPWGERLETAERAAWLHAALGHTMSSIAADSTLTLLGANVEVLDRCAMTLEKQFTLLNGAEKNWIRAYKQRALAPAIRLFPQAPDGEIATDAAAFANRLQKNARKLKSWLAGSELEVYRLYDRDLPDFNFTIDVYADKVLVQEWKAPKEIANDKIAERRRLALLTLRQVLGCHREQVFLRTRERQKGHSQYNKLAEKQRYFVVNEGPAKLLVNLQDYHDTGLFLDHRLMRKRLAEEAKGKRLLNLFAYTCSATVQAAVGGAKASVSVDSSKRYLEWGACSLARNGFSTLDHQLVCADVRRWVAANHDQFDVMFCDPPTFSNSKGRDDFVVQRDHAELIINLMKHLTNDGVLYFSCNFRGFVLDSSLANRYAITDITQQTLDHDVAIHQPRHAAIHHCFEIRYAN